MSPRSQISFLPIFFAILIAGFAIAVTLRIRSYREGATNAKSDTAAVSTSGRGGDSSAVLTGSAESPGEGPFARASATSTAAAPAGETPAARSAREQRYRELLRTPLPPRNANAPQGGAGGMATAPGTRTTAAQPPKPPAQQPSLLSRIVAPVAKVFGGAGSHPQSSGSASTSTAPAEPPKDPNSDVTPPRLVSATFDPPTVQDGEQTTLLAIATDDISGVRSIAGNLISPSGALQGFALNRQGDGTQYAGRILVPKNAAEGVWRINYLNLTDNANNSAFLSANQGSLPVTASFRVVSSNADSSAPTLRSAWLDRPSMKGGEKNVLFVTAEDDKSGVNLVSGVFLSPAKVARIGFGCLPADGGGPFRCEFALPPNADCGDWQLEQVQLQDKANNTVAVRRENPLVGGIHVSAISDQCDSHPPVVDNVTLDRYSTPAPGTIIIRVSVTDDISGVNSLSGHFVYTGAVAPGSQPPKLWFSCSMSDPQTWSGSVSIPDKAAIGVWRLEQLQAVDKSNNLKIYNTVDPIVGNVTFRVQ